MEIVIEKNIPLAFSSEFSPMAAAMKKMETGDSFCVEARDSQCRVAAAARERAKMLKIKITIRKLPDQPGKIRIWRIE